MRFYMAEKEVMDFLRGYHTLKEWANFGFNKVIYNNEAYCDGYRLNGGRITDEENKEAGLLDWVERDWDADGYMYIVLEKVGERWYDNKEGK